MRACQPHRSDYVENGGVKIHYEVFGNGANVLLLPAWAIVHSRLWKAQVPYLARRFRVITFDGRGNGLSDRPKGPGAYRTDDYVADAVAVLDATQTGSAVVVGVSLGGHVAAMLAARHPQRVTGAVLIAPSAPFGPTAAGRLPPAYFRRQLDTDEGWAKFNEHYWRRDFRGFVEFFLAQCFNEPHSTKQIEDAVSWALETTAETLIDTALARNTAQDDGEHVYRAIRRPAVVVHGDRDRIFPHARSALVAGLIGAPLVTLEGCGHLPVAREPVMMNLLIRDFVERTAGVGMPPAAVRRAMTGANADAPADDLPQPQHFGNRPAVCALGRRRRVLYLSSPIGLGHGRRDIAIARRLRELQPDLQVDWLAQHPVTALLESAGERMHPASRLLVNESTHIEGEAGEHDLHVFQALRTMDEILIANFMLFQEVVEDGDYDLVVADEAWDVDHFWHENPRLKRGALAWFTDFVGYMPMPEGGDREEYITSDYNAEMIEHIEQYPRVRDRAIFVGNAQDIVPGTFGRGLPEIRAWTEQHFAFCGYVTGREPNGLASRAELRSRFGFGKDEKICIVTVGGSGVGTHLLKRIIESAPAIRRRVPELRMIVVAGPRVDLNALPRQPRVEIRAYVADLDERLAACDIALVQGGLTTCMELAAANVPFLYFPLRNHFEQNVHVRYRLERYRAGHLMRYESATPDEIAAALLEELSCGANCAPVETDGAQRAACLLAELL